MFYVQVKGVNEKEWRTVARSKEYKPAIMYSVTLQNQFGFYSQVIYKEEV